MSSDAAVNPKPVSGEFDSQEDLYSSPVPVGVVADTHEDPAEMATAFSVGPDEEFDIDSTLAANYEAIE